MLNISEDDTVFLVQELRNVVTAKTGRTLYSSDIDHLINVVQYGDTWNAVLSRERDGLTDYTIELKVNAAGVKILVVKDNGETEWEAPTFDEAYNYIH